MARTAARSGALLRSFERRVGGAAFVDHVVHGECGRGQRFGARRVTAAARLWRRIAPDFALHGHVSCAEPQAGEAHGVGEIARRNRPLARALQLAHGEHAFAAGHAQAVVGDA